jgi:hypothetical protein
VSVASSDVNVQVRFDTASIALLLQLTEDAVQRAIAATVDDLRSYAASGQAQVPVKTGRLKGSFDVASTPRSIVFKWSAIDPKSNYDYAKIQDEGGMTGTGGWIAGKYFSYTTADYARERLMAHLQEEIQAIGSVAA